MKVMLIILIMIILLAISLLIYVKVGLLKNALKITKKLMPITEALKKREELNEDIIKELAADPFVRNSLYDELAKFDKIASFPAIKVAMLSIFAHQISSLSSEGGLEPSMSSPLLLTKGRL